MTHDPKPSDPDPNPTALWRWSVRLFLLVALGISGFLLQHTLAGQGSLPGCGADTGFDCDSVLNSRWSTVAGIPTSGMAMGLYIILLGSLNLVNRPAKTQAWFILATGAVSVLSVGLWFVVVQLWIIKAICPWCMGAHAAGSIAAILILLASSRCARNWGVVLGLLGVSIFICLQLIIIPPTHRVEQLTTVTTPLLNGEENNLPSTPDKPTGSLSAGGTTKDLRPSQQPTSGGTSGGASGGSVRLMGGRVVMSPHKHPIMGSPDAPHILLYLFDYTCPHCRALHSHLEEALVRYKGQLAVVILPMPLNSDCNPTVNQTEPRHRDACSFAILSLAVWHINPSQHAIFDRWMIYTDFATITPDTARAKAIELVGKEALDAAIASAWVRDELTRNIKLYQFSGGGVIPKLIGKNTLIAGRPGSALDLFEVLEEELGLQAN